MIFFIFLLTLVSLQSFLLLSTKTILFPEMYFFPWLVSKGLVPYKDFFDHHGFLTYYLLSPFIKNGVIENLKYIFFFFQNINLLLALLILKKTTTKLGFYIGGILLLLVNFYIGENILWYETFITTCFLAIYSFFLKKENKYLFFLMGILAGLSTIIKITAIVILIPILLYKRKKEIVIGFGSVIAIVILFFLTQQALPQLLNLTFNYNIFISSFFHPSYSLAWKLWAGTIILFLISIYILFKKDKKLISLFAIFFISTLPSVKTGFGGEHVLPIATFIVILISQAIDRNKKNLGKIFIFGIVVYIGIIGLKSVQRYKELKHDRIPWQEDLPTKQTEKEIVEKIKPGENIYVFSNHGEIYMKLNTLPKTYYPLFFPGVKVYFPDFEDKIIDELKQNKIQYIIIPDQVDKEQLQMKKVLQFVEKEYKIEKETDMYKLLKRI